MRHVALVAALFLCAIVAAVYAAPSKAAQASFLTWLSKHNIAVPPVKAVDFVDSGAGMMATADISSETKLVAVTRDLFLSSAMLNRTALAEPLAAISGLTPQYKLALVLLTEAAKGPASFWHPYIDTLPAVYDTPIYWDAEEMSELKGSNLLPLTQARQQQLKANYDQVFGYVFENFPAAVDKSVFTYERFQWAISTVWKYSFFVKDGEETVSVLVPLLDRFNHGPVETQFRLAEDGTLEVSTKSAFKKGEQVYVSRGPKSNLELVLDYGYALETNANDNVALNVRMTGDDRSSKLKQSMLQIAGLEVNATYLLFESTIPNELMTGLRVQLLRDAEMDKFERVADGKPATLSNELRVYRAILAACNNMLQAYGTSLEDDEALLKTQLGVRERSAVVLRRNEKKVIQSVMVEVSKRWRDILLDGFAETPEEIAAQEKQQQEQQAQAQTQTQQEQKDEL